MKYKMIPESPNFTPQQKLDHVIRQSQSNLDRCDFSTPPYVHGFYFGVMKRLQNDDTSGKWAGDFFEGYMDAWFAVDEFVQAGARL